MRVSWATVPSWPMVGLQIRSQLELARSPGQRHYVLFQALFTVNIVTEAAFFCAGALFGESQLVRGAALLSNGLTLSSRQLGCNLNIPGPGSKKTARFGQALKYTGKLDMNSSAGWRDMLVSI